MSVTSNADTFNPACPSEPGEILEELAHFSKTPRTHLNSCDDQAPLLTQPVDITNANRIRPAVSPNFSTKLFDGHSRHAEFTLNRAAGHTVVKTSSKRQRSNHDCSPLAEARDGVCFPPPLETPGANRIIDHRVIRSPQNLFNTPDDSLKAVGINRALKHAFLNAVTKTFKQGTHLLPLPIISNVIRDYHNHGHVLTTIGSKSPPLRRAAAKSLTWYSRHLYQLIVSPRRR